MRQRTYISLAFIILLGIFAGWLALSNPIIQLGEAKREVKVHLGLDLQGGMRVLLQVPPDTMMFIFGHALISRTVSIRARTPGASVGRLPKIKRMSG